MTVPSCLAVPTTISNAVLNRQGFRLYLTNHIGGDNITVIYINDYAIAVSFLDTLDPAGRRIIAGSPVGAPLDVTLKSTALLTQVPGHILVFINDAACGVIRVTP